MSIKLLVIDDEQIILDSIKSYFERRGYAVFPAHRGDIGLELLKEHGPGLLLLDLHMKEGIQGMEILQRALALKPDLKVAILTGFGGDADVEATCLKLGAKVVLKKPLALEALKAEVDKLQTA
jgi:DNA-binding response OmpR family regulator